MTPRRVELVLDVSGAAGTGERLRSTATVVLPPAARLAARPLVAVAYPGAGYSRRYFDLRIAGRRGYSQAAHWAGAGHFFVCCDHLGAGDADVPTRPIAVEAVAEAGGAVARQVLATLEDGSLTGYGARIHPAAVLGLGQSYGGFLLTMLQAHDPVFDGVAFLGWSGVGTLPPWPPGVSRNDVLAGAAGNGLDHPMRPWFHHPAEPIDLVRRDMNRPRGRAGPTEPWGSLHAPGGPARTGRTALTPGVVGGEAATIDVPVLVACGAIDVVPDPEAERPAYPRSPAVTVTVVERMAHMHNFAVNRRRLWDAVLEWAGTVPARATTGI